MPLLQRSEKSIRHGFNGLLCLVAFTIPFKAIFNSILIIALLVVWLLAVPKSFSKIQYWLIAAISSVFILAVWGMFFTQNIDEGFFRLQQKALVPVFALVIGTSSWYDKNSEKWALTAFLVGMLCASAYSFGIAFIHTLSSGSYAHFFAHGLVEALDLYTYIFAILCLIAVFVLLESYLGNLALHPVFNRYSTMIFLVILFSSLLFLLSVKQVLIAWGVLVMIYAWRLTKNHWYFLAAIAMVAVVGSCLIFIIPSLYDKFNEVVASPAVSIPLDQDASLGKSWDGIALRKAIWTCAAEVVSQNFWWGTGTGDAQDALQQAYEARQFYFASRFNHFNAHNQYIQTWIAFGLIGLIFCILSWVFIYWNRKGSPALISFVICMTLCFFTESMLETNKGNLIYGFFSSLFVFGNSQRRL